MNKTYACGQRIATTSCDEWKMFLAPAERDSGHQARLTQPGSVLFGSTSPAARSLCAYVKLTWKASETLACSLNMRACGRKLRDLEERAAQGSGR